MKFIKLHTCANDNPIHDTEIYIVIDMVESISAATLRETKIHKEIHSLISLHNGNTYAVKEFPDVIIEMINDTNLVP